MSAIRRTLIPAQLQVDLNTNIVSINAMNDVSGPDVAPVFMPIANHNRMLSLQDDGHRTFIGGMINTPVTLDVGYPVSTEAPAMTLPNIIKWKAAFDQDNDVTGLIFTIIGSGGTGGYVIRDMLRYLQSLKTKGDTRQFIVNLVDADIVEEKNLIRQNFIVNDLNKKKAVVLANRYSSAFGIPVIPHDLMIKSYRELNTFFTSARSALLSGNDNGEHFEHIIIGCVDNHAARRVIYDYVNRNPNVIWIDSGNERTSGQVVCGTGNFKSSYGGYTPEEIEDEIESGSYYSIPNIVDYYPEILDPTQDLAGSDDTSCAERALVEDQNIFINMSAAINVLNFVRQVVGNELMSSNIVEFDIRGLSKTTLLTPENLSKVACL